MAQAIGVAFSAPPVCCPSNVGSSLHQQCCSSHRAMPKSNFRIVCQQANHSREPAPEVSRRSLALAGAAAAAGLGILSGSEAEAKRKAPVPEEKKPEDDKNLSAYDARLLASARRKEALKANIEKAKAAASQAAGSVAAELPTVKLE